MNESNEPRWLFGPVPSRRLGRSLGIDLVPYKVCTLDCVYCECGATTRRTLTRREWVPTVEVLSELSAWLEAGGRADYLTFSGNGEPTLHSDLGRIARWLVTRTPIPLALLTNGTLLSDPKVLAELRPLSLIVPSLDAADDQTYQRVNRPHPGLTAADLIDGLVALRDSFEGSIWLEVLLIEGLNDSERSLDSLAAAIERIQPDRVQVNTAVRPGTEATVLPASEATLARALERFGPRAEAVATFDAGRHEEADAARWANWSESILAVIRRRPETVDNLAASLGLNPLACRKCVAQMAAEGRVRTESRAGSTFVTATDRA